MHPAFRYMDVDVEPLRLFTKERILALMYYKGAYGPTLDWIRKQYESLFGAELVWRYPIMDDAKEGCVLIPVREGFLRLPYDGQMEDTYEYYQVKDAELLNRQSLETLHRELTSYAAGLASALSEMAVAVDGVPIPEEQQRVLLKLPDGQIIQANVGGELDYPAIQISRPDPLGEKLPELLCFVEHNPNRPVGHQLCIGVYHGEKDEPAYYKSYVSCEQDYEGV